MNLKDFFSCYSPPGHVIHFYYSLLLQDNLILGKRLDAVVAKLIQNDGANHHKCK